MPCPGFTYDRFCSKNCSCVEENSVGCDKRSGTCECKPQFYGERCEQSCDQIKSEFSQSNLNCLERKVHALSNDKTALEQNLADHRTNLDYHKTLLEQSLTSHRSSLEERFEKLTNDKAALEEQVADHKYNLTWNTSFTCAAFLLLFVAISRMYLKNRKLKADLKVVSARYSEKQRNDSISEAKVTFSCIETTDSPDRSNMFKSVLGKFRLLTQNVPATSIDQPTYGTNLLEETDQINAEIYATIDELKEQNAKEEAIRMPEN